MRLIRRWTWIVVAGLAGALLALAAATLVPPVYESYAELGVSLDYGRTPPLDLIVEDRVLGRVSSYLLSSEVLGAVRQDLMDRQGNQAEWTDLAALRRHVRLDAVLAQWRLTGISRDPQRAADIANAWAAESLKALEAASAHAWQALNLQRAPVTVACAEVSTGNSLDFFWQCLAVGGGLQPEEVVALQRHVQLSHGILPIVSYAPLSQARPPERPVLWRRSTLVASGTLAGLLVGVLVAGLTAPSRGRGSDERPATGAP